MDELKIGNFPKSSQNYDIDLSKDPNIEVTEPVNEPVNETQPEPVEPTQEPVNTTVPPVEPQPSNEPSSLTPDNSQPEPEVTNEIDEESAFKFLSEKLGKEIKSFDDLKTSPVENPLEKDPYLKELHEWRNKTGRPIEDWIKFQKDYGKLDDLEVAREFLQYEYPSFTPEEIEAEMKAFQPSEDDLDDEISAKIRNLKKYSTKGRGVLKELVSNLDLPDNSKFTPEVQEDLNLAKQVKLNIAESKKQEQLYNSEISKVSQTVDSLDLNLDDNLTISFKVPDESKQTLPDLITTMPHWKNEDGSFNHQAIVQDAVIIKHYKEMVKLAFEQGKNSGKEELVNQTNNTTLGEPTPMSGQPSSSKGIQIEGFDEFVGKSGMKLKFNK